MAVVFQQAHYGTRCRVHTGRWGSPRHNGDSQPPLAWLWRTRIGANQCAQDPERVPVSLAPELHSLFKFAFVDTTVDFEGLCHALCQGFVNDLVILNADKNRFIAGLGVKGGFCRRRA